MLQKNTMWKFALALIFDGFLQRQKQISIALFSHCRTYMLAIRIHHPFTVLKCSCQKSVLMHAILNIFLEEPGGRLNIKMSSYQNRDPHVKDKTVSRSYYLNMEISVPGKDGLYIETGPRMFPFHVCKLRFLVMVVNQCLTAYNHTRMENFWVCVISGQQGGSYHGSVILHFWR